MEQKPVKNPLCEGCGACCKCILSFYPYKPEAGWLYARGVSKLVGPEYLAIPSVCKYYDERIGCLIQEKKPKACKEFVVGGQDCLACRKWLQMQREKVV
jgi:hypothetical protein